MAHLHIEESGQPKKDHRETPSSPEKIQSAAIVYNGTVYTGINHALAIMELERQHPHWQRESAGPVREVFLTTTKRIVDRKEAARIADSAGQTEESHPDSRVTPDELDSSELTLH